MASATADTPLSKGSVPPGKKQNRIMILIKPYGRDHMGTALYCLAKNFDNRTETLANIVVREGVQHVNVLNSTGDVRYIGNGGLYSDDDEMEIAMQDLTHMASISNKKVVINYGQHMSTFSYSTPHNPNYRFSIYHLIDDRDNSKVAAITLGENRTTFLIEDGRTIGEVELDMLVMLLVKMSYSTFGLHKQPMANGILSQLPPEVPPRPSLDSLKTTRSLILRMARSIAQPVNRVLLFYYELMDFDSHKIQFIAKLQTDNTDAIISIHDQFGSTLITGKTSMVGNDPFFPVFDALLEEKLLGQWNVQNIGCVSPEDQVVMKGSRHQTRTPILAKATRMAKSKPPIIPILRINSPYETPLAEIYPKDFNTVLRVFDEEPLTEKEKALLICLAVRHSAFEFKSTGQHGIDSPVYPFRKKSG